MADLEQRGLQRKALQGLLKRPAIKGYSLRDCIGQQMSKGIPYPQARSICMRATGKMPTEV